MEIFACCMQGKFVHNFKNPVSLLGTLKNMQNVQVISTMAVQLDYKLSRMLEEIQTTSLPNFVAERITMCIL